MNIFKLLYEIFGESSERMKRMPMSAVKSEINSKLRDLDVVEANQGESRGSDPYIATQRKSISALQSEISMREFWRNKLTNVPIPTPEQVQIVSIESCFSAPDGLKEKLLAIQAAFERDNAEISKYSGDEANRAFYAHRNGLHSTLAETGNVSSYEVKSKEAFQEEYKEKRHAYTLAVQRHLVEARKLIQPILDDFAANVSDQADQLEEGQRARAERFLLKFEPDQALALFRKTHLSVEDGMIPSGGCPKDYAAFIV